MSEFVIDLARQFEIAFIVDDRWKYIVSGIGSTLLLTFLSLILGVVIGIIIAAIRATHDKQIDEMHPGIGKSLLKFANGFCRCYLTIFRGTPVMVQILIIFFVIMASSRNKMLCGVIAFGLNSAAYVAEIIRGGIMSIDPGQTEAGRSLGLSYVQTMAYIVLPQAFKNILPSLANEFITLLKETSIAGYVGVTDITRGANIIRGITYQSFWPLFAIAAIYLGMVMFFTWLVDLLERRFKNSER
ncbi:MAG: amino acid ABC transporter permease [Clostridia bacterium]|nr:amino acid ABC transporter permease [Clostridia bacterium]